jgi:hypothetical protein
VKFKKWLPYTTQQDGMFFAFSLIINLTNRFCPPNVPAFAIVAKQPIRQGEYIGFYIGTFTEVKKSLFLFMSLSKNSS